MTYDQSSKLTARYTNLTPVTLQGILGVTVVLEIHFLGSKGVERVKYPELPVYAKAEKVLQGRDVITGNLPHSSLQAGSETVGRKRPLGGGGYHPKPRSQIKQNPHKKVESDDIVLINGTGSGGS